jgi:sugar phosphate isomerase/epimerase
MIFKETRRQSVGAVTAGITSDPLPIHRTSHRMQAARDISSRREFLRTAALASATLGIVHELFASEPRIEFPTKPRDRLAVTSWPFRAFLDAPGNSARNKSKDGMALIDFPGMIASRFGVHNINPLSAHFGSGDAWYIDKLRSAVEKAGSHLVDLGLSGRAFYHPAPEKRAEAVAYGKRWIDIAVSLGCPSVRQHISGAPGVKADVNLTAESLGELAAYGAKRNVVVNLENDSPFSEDPFFLMAVIDKLGNPYLRGLPDFANSMKPDGDAERNYKAVAGMFQRAFNMCHVKEAYADDGRTYKVDLARLFTIAHSSGYRGYFSMEVDSVLGDPYESTLKLIQQTLSYLNLEKRP